MKIYYNSRLKQLARNLRNKSTFSEVLLWNQLKGRKMRGYPFIRQKPIGNYIVDFFCSRLGLVIEIDGDETHKFSYKTDAVRQQRLERLGLSVLRFDDRGVRYDMRNVLKAIEVWIDEYEEMKDD